MTENSRHGAAARAGLRLDDRVVLVTGGGRGIGAEAARLLADMGAHVVVVDNGVSVEGNPEEPGVAETVVAGITGAGGSATAVTCDAADYDAVGDVVHEIVRDHGSLYGVVAAAGTLRVRAIWEMTPDDWDSMMWSHARHTFVVARHAAAHWVDEYRAGRLNGGRLVTMCAATGLVGRPDLGSNHAAAKGAVAGFTLELAHELYPIGVTVNGVAAANVRGRMADYVNAYVPDVQEDHDPGDPRHAARVLAYLCTEDAGWLTGQVLRVMGGLLGRYQPWQLAESLTRDADWTLRDLRLGVRRLFGAYPEYRPMDGPHRAG